MPNNFFVTETIDAIKSLKPFGQNYVLFGMLCFT